MPVKKCWIQDQKYVCSKNFKKKLFGNSSMFGQIRKNGNFSLCKISYMKMISWIFYKKCFEEHLFLLSCYCSMFNIRSLGPSNLMVKNNCQKVAFWSYLNKHIFGLEFNIFCWHLKTHMLMSWKPTSNNSYRPSDNSRLTVYLNPQRGIWK